MLCGLFLFLVYFIHRLSWTIPVFYQFSFMKSLDETSQILECSSFLIIFVMIYYERRIKKRMHRIGMQNFRNQSIGKRTRWRGLEFFFDLECFFILGMFFHLHTGIFWVFLLWIYKMIFHNLAVATNRNLRNSFTWKN